MKKTISKIDFVPFPTNIVVLPEKNSSFFEEGKFREVGEVVAVGELVTFVKVGDIVYFNAEGIRQNEKSDDSDIQYYVIREEPEFILGKKNGKTKKESTLVK